MISVALSHDLPLLGTAPLPQAHKEDSKAGGSFVFFPLSKGQVGCFAEPYRYTVQITPDSTDTRRLEGYHDRWGRARKHLLKFAGSLENK